MAIAPHAIVAHAPSITSTPLPNQDLNVPVAPARTYPEPLLNKEQRVALRAEWKALVAAHTAECRKWDALSGQDRLWKRKPEFDCFAPFLYAVLLGRDWRKGISPIRSARKRGNGTVQQWAFWRIVHRVQSVRQHTSEVNTEEEARGRMFFRFASLDSVIQVKAIRAVARLTNITRDLDTTYTLAENIPAAYEAYLTQHWPAQPYRESV